MNRRVITFAAGAALTVGLTACKGKSTATAEEPEGEPIRTANPPAPATDDTIPEADAPEPEPASEVTIDRDPAKPRWDDVPSGHPKGATNPPIPELLVTADGHCFKRWVSPMIRRAPDDRGDRLATCGPDDDCGTAIQCPDRAADILAGKTGPK